MGAVTNKNENEIVIGEIKLINSVITDSAGDPVEFATLTSAEVIVFDILGNKITPPVTVGSTSSSLQYEVDTNTLREGDIRAQLTLTYPDATLAGGTATDIIIQELFTLKPTET